MCVYKTISDIRIVDRPEEVVIQRNSNTSTIDFNRTWEEYAAGFSHSDSLWLGLEQMHELTRLDSYKLTITFTLNDGSTLFSGYDTFIVDNNCSDYTLTVGSYSGGTLKDTFSINSGSKFTTYDRDNDVHAAARINCAKFYALGWWFTGCGDIWLNGDLSEAKIKHNAEKQSFKLSDIAEVEMRINLK